MRKKSLDVEEYISLRKEILQWQARRFFLITTTATLVTGILGFGIGNIEKMWFMISSSLLLFLACTTSLSWYAGKGNAKIGAYIAVFFEEIGGNEDGLGWESRLLKFKDAIKDTKGKLNIFDKFHLNYFISAFNAVFGILSGFIPWLAAGKPSPTLYQFIIVISTAALFLVTLVLLFKFSYPREHYIDQWRKVKEEEQKNE